MPLEPETLQPAVELWSGGLAQPWTADEARRITNLLVDLAAAVTPRIVDDVALTDAERQAYLLARTVGAVEDWLTAAAATVRRTYGITAPRLVSGGVAPALGLRTATRAEIEALPGIGGALATDLSRFLAQRPELTDLDQIDVEGIGPARRDRLKVLSYLERPIVGLMSAPLAAFALRPSVPAFLRLLETSDMAFFYGDQTTLARRGAVAAASAFDRFVDFLALVLDHGRRAASQADGALASDAAAWLTRHAKRRAMLDGLADADGSLLVNDAYIAQAKALLDGAARSVNLMVFLATDVAGPAGAPGPKDLVEALEAAAARDVAVRVILDQDDGGEPYKSFFINRDLVARLRARGVQVKFDRKDVLLHSKLLIVDGSTVLLGSHNWTRASFYDTHEMAVALQCAPLAGDMDARFDRLWDSLP